MCSVLVCLLICCWCCCCDVCYDWFDYGDGVVGFGGDGLLDYFVVG